MKPSGRDISQKLSQASVHLPSGQQVELGSFWAKQPALLIFLRHFGCIACTEQVDRLLPVLPNLNELGINVVLVGNGQTQYVDGFIARLGLADKALGVVTDPTGQSHKLAGMQSSLLGGAGPRAIWKGHTMAPGPNGDRRGNLGHLLFAKRFNDAHLLEWLIYFYKSCPNLPFVFRKTTGELYSRGRRALQARLSSPNPSGIQKAAKYG